MNILIVHPWKRILHNQYKEYFFMPERAVQIATFLEDEDYNVDFIDFGRTDLDENVNSDIDNPKGVRGTGESLTHYGISEEETQEWLDENLQKYDKVIIDSLMPYFRQGVEQVIEACKSDDIEHVLYGEWVGLRPQDFEQSYAVTGNWELGCKKFLEDELERGVNWVGFQDVGMDDLPVPDWNRWVDMEDYPEPERADYRATRGCPENCDFCHVFGNWDRTFKFKTADKIKDDLEFLIDEGFDKIQLRDDNFCAHVGNATEVFEWLGENYPDVEILQVEGMEMKTAANSPELIEAIGECNYHSVRIGFETAVEGQFDKNKLEWWEKAYEKFVEVGFKPDQIITWVLAGHPKLSREDEIRTALYLSQYGVRIIPSSYREVPGTELYNEETPYIQGQKYPQDDENVDRVKKMYRCVSMWNQWGVDVFRDDIPNAFYSLDFVDNVAFVGDQAVIEGTVSGWSRGEALEFGFWIYGVKDGQYGVQTKKDTKEEKVYERMLSHDKFGNMVNDVLYEEGLVNARKGGLL